ncbi:MAG: LptF/LptG family permease [Rikenellaceae bacterium]|nr:LptF/LptG family permease [Rikenellaceae bacterium]
MKTMYKLIIKSYLGPMFLTFFIVMFVLLMNFMFRYIDELVGKGLDFSVIGELMLYASMTMISMGLPLATLLASIMTMGNLGENNELLAMKCAGMSFPKIIAPLSIIILLFGIGSFFAVNNLVPYSWSKIYALLYDIRKQSQSLEFKEGIFFNGLPDMSVRIDKKNEQSGLMEGILIYDTSNRNGTMMVTVADSGYIRLSDDKNYILITLYSGQSYEQNRGADWANNSTFNHHIFDVQNMAQAVEGFTMERSDESAFVNQKTKNIRELTDTIATLQYSVDSAVSRLNNQFLSNALFVYNREMAIDTLQQNRTEQLNLLDSIAALSVEKRTSVVKSAMASVSNAKTHIQYDELQTKQNVNSLYKYQTDWHRMLSLPASIIIFFFIGASLGAIIRKGGLGMPIVVSVTFFIVYYIITIFGEKLSKEGTWSAFAGTWLSTFVLIPVAVFLTIKATNDSNLLNGDWYYHQIQRVKGFIQHLIDKFKTKRDERKQA